MKDIDKFKRFLSHYLTEEMSTDTEREMMAQDYHIESLFNLMESGILETYNFYLDYLDSYREKHGSSIVDDYEYYFKSETDASDEEWSMMNEYQRQEYLAKYENESPVWYNVEDGHDLEPLSFENEVLELLESFDNNFLSNYIHFRIIEDSLGKKDCGYYLDVSGVDKVIRAKQKDNPAMFRYNRFNLQEMSLFVSQATDYVFKDRSGEF